MRKLEFNIVINATPEEVWQVIIGKDTYGQWTAPFASGSSVETDWKKGSKALFLDGKGHGMVSRIAESIPGKFLSIQHLGDYKDGVEDLNGYETEGNDQFFENYKLEEIDGKTHWQVTVDTQEDWAKYMEDTFPEAMAKVKELAEDR